jgi:sugar lactone lactonase YvrE
MQHIEMQLITCRHQGRKSACTSHFFQSYSSIDAAQVTISSTARWSEYAITVAGSWSGRSGSDLNLLSWNRGLCITDDGTLYVADTGNGRIVVIQPNSTIAVATIQTARMSSRYGGFVDVSVTKTNVYVLDNSAQQVNIWSINRSNPSTIDESSLNIMTFDGSLGSFFVDQDDNLYVNDRSRSTITFYPSNTTNNSAGVVVAGNGTPGSAPDQLYDPLGIFVDDNRSLYIADYENNRIQKWTYGASAGVTVAGNGECSADTLSQLCRPKFVIVDSNQNIYTVDIRFTRIVRWTIGADRGECIAACSGGKDLQSNNLYSAYTIAFDSQGSLYVSDMFNNRVQKFQIISDLGKSTERIYDYIFKAYKTYCGRQCASN